MLELLPHCEVAYIPFWTNLWICRKICLYTALAILIMISDFRRYTSKNSNCSSTKHAEIIYKTRCPFVASGLVSAYHTFFFPVTCNQKQMYLPAHLLYIFLVKRVSFSALIKTLNAVNDRIWIKIGLNKIKFIGSHN